MIAQPRRSPALAWAPLALLAASVPAALGQGPVTIGVAPPQVHLGQGDDASEALRQAVIGRIRSPGVEPVALVGSTPGEIEADARGKRCDQILYTDVERKHGAGGFLSKLAPLAGVLPSIAGAGGGGGGGSGSGVAGVIAQVATNAAANAATSSMIKRGDNITLDYRFLPVSGGAPIKSETLHAKADADGQDVLSPLVAQLAQAVNPAAPAAAAAAPTPAEGARAEHTGFLHGLFGSRGGGASAPAPATAPPAAGAMPDCAQIASMPNTPISLETCQKMAAAQQTYTRAASDPGASRPGDELMGCDQIKAEMSQQQIRAPDKATVAETTAAVDKERGMLAKHMAEQSAVSAEEQAKVNAAVAADQATAMATGGLVQTNTASAAAMAAQARARAVGERQAAERRPTEQKMYGGVADLGVGAAQQLASNPRLARLLQLAQARGCRGS
jgi:hypothetical protein